MARGRKMKCVVPGNRRLAVCVKSAAPGDVPTLFAHHGDLRSAELLRGRARSGACRLERRESRVTVLALGYEHIVTKSTFIFNSAWGAQTEIVREIRVGT